MKRLITILALAALAGIAQAQTYVTNLVPSGDFTSGFNAGDWTNNAANSNTVFSYPATGGNPAGYALMDSSAPGTAWGVFVGAGYDGTAGGTPIPIATLNLTAGIPCTVLMDMRIEAGTAIGGLKLESYDSGNLLIAGSDLEQRPGSGTTNWATYAFPYTPAVGATGIKFVPLWGANSSVGYDNVRVIATTAVPLTAAITSPTNLATVNTNFTILASASVLPGSVTNVDFYLGSSLLGSDDTAPFSLGVTGAPLGATNLTVVAQDDNGNSVTSAVVNVTIAAAVVQTTVLVDPAKNWSTFMRVRETPQNFNAQLFEVPGWGTGDLVAVFSGVGPASVLTLKPTPINDLAAYWYDYTQSYYPTGAVGAVGNKEMEAIKYVQPPDGALNGNLVTFTGTCLTNTLDIRLNPGSTNLIGNGWTNYAYVKDFAPDYSSVVESLVVLTSGLPFSVSLQTIANPTRHIQYGFVTRGPNVWPTDVDNYGIVQIRSLDASPTNVYVDSSKTWSAFMNWFQTPQNGGGYVGGGGWGTADLCAVFNSYGLILSPNTIGNPDPFWYTPSGGPGALGNKIMDASMYVEIGSLPGRNLIFSGNVLSNTLVSASNTNAAGNGWTSVAFIKDFAPDYSSANTITVPLTPGAFSISLNTVNDPARHVQYGFETVGPNVWVTDVAPFGNVVIGNVGLFPTPLTAGQSGGNISLSFPTQLGKVYTVQYKNLLTDPTWSPLTTTNGTGASTALSDPTGNSQRFYRLSIQ